MLLLLDIARQNVLSKSSHNWKSTCWVEKEIRVWISAASATCWIWQRPLANHNTLRIGLWHYFYSLSIVNQSTVPPPLMSCHFGSNSTWLDSTRLDSTHSTCRAHAFWLCRASRTAQLDSLDTTSSTGSTGSTCRARLARHVELDRRYLQLSYDHRNSYCLISYSLINWSIH